MTAALLANTMRLASLSKERLDNTIANHRVSVTLAMPHTHTHTH